MKKLFYPISLVVFGILVTDTCQSDTFEGTIVLENVSIVDPVRADILEQMSILIENDRIIAIGPSAVMSVPDGTIQINGSDQFVLPGLVDAHMHLWESPDDLILYLSWGITSARSLDGNPEHVTWRDEVIAGKRDGPTVYTSGPILYGRDSPLWKEIPDTVEAARAIVTQHKDIGYDYVKVYYQVKNSQYDALVGAAREVGIPIVGHVPWSQSIRDILDAGQFTNEHLSGFDVELQDDNSPVRDVHTAWGNMLRYQHDDESRIPEMARMISHYKHWNVPTLLIFEMFTRPEEVEQLMSDEKMMGLLSGEMRDRWSSYNRWQIPPISDFSDEDREVMRNAVQDRREFVKSLHDAGAGIAAGTDGGGRFMFPGLSLHKELEIYVSLGMTEAEALRTATSNGAKALADEDEFGTISPGMRADLMLIARNPLEDITATQEIEGVMTRGKWYSRHDLDGLLSDLRARRSNP